MPQNRPDVLSALQNSAGKLSLFAPSAKACVGVRRDNTVWYWTVEDGNSRIGHERPNHCDALLVIDEEQLNAALQTGMPPALLELEGDDDLLAQLLALCLTPSGPAQTRMAHVAAESP